MTLKAALFRAGNDFRLQLRADVDEVVAVARDADDQIALFLGLGLGLAKHISRHDVALEVMSAEANSFGPSFGSSRSCCPIWSSSR